MSDKISENVGIDSWKVSPEQLVEAIKLVWEFAKKNPEAAIKLVKESLTNVGGDGGSTTSGISGRGSAGNSRSAANF